MNVGRGLSPTLRCFTTLFLTTNVQGIRASVMEAFRLGEATSELRAQTERGRSNLSRLAAIPTIGTRCRRMQGYECICQIGLVIEQGLATGD